MDKQQLIQAILREADAEPSHVISNAIVRPLNNFGVVWYAEGRWWFSEEIAEIGTYTANGGSIARYGQGQFEVKHPTQEEMQRARDDWNSGAIFGYGKLESKEPDQ